MPQVIEMQSEGGAAGAVHGALQAGALTDHVHRVAGTAADDPEHVQDRRRADPVLHARLGAHRGHPRAVHLRRPLRCHGLPADGLRLLTASASVQEAHDLALIAHAATLKARVPFLHFFDGFRTSHEVAKIAYLGDDELRAMIDDELITAHRRARAHARPAGAARHGAEPGRVLPGARGVQSVL